MKYITGGGLRIDYLITPDGQAYCGLPGGNSLYAGVGAFIWGKNVGLWARLGENYPQHWIDDLANTGLDTKGLVRIPGDKDHRTFFAYTRDGRRDDTHPARHFKRIGQPLPDALVDYIHSTPNQDAPDVYEPLALRPGDWPEDWRGKTAVHLSPHALRSHLHIPPALRQKGVHFITLDPGERYMIPECEPYIRRILPHIDAFLPSDQEVRSFFGENVNFEEAARTFHDWGAKIVVFKVGEGGVLVWDENGRFHHLPPYHLPGDPRVIDVTGAGDAFCGGFLVGLTQTRNAVKAAKMGLVSASFVVEGYSALYALKTPRTAVHARLSQLQKNRVV